MALNNDTKAEIIKKFKKSDKDCGSSSVQIALLTENINKLSDHFNKNKKDNHFETRSFKDDYEKKISDEISQKNRYDHHMKS